MPLTAACRAHETPEHLVCRLLLEKKKKKKKKKGVTPDATELSHITPTAHYHVAAKVLDVQVQLQTLGRTRIA
ncbi:hypothetical protein EHSB41UT_04819 [Parendozoicomonas haliclonae]|uniref:Uncharacterized protein n=1 Tax=Parendozoicomonas haliclonae TaxID=1960125 RepID=A0A1X7AS72_9GAMM|nr:hypothetical protein EHSB41UT_04819 [Parendozoicomonas haliclonae]